MHKKSIKIVMFFLFFTSICEISYSNEIISFEETIQRALIHSFDLKITNLDLAIKNNDVTKAFMSRFPELTASLSSNFTEQLDDKQSYYNPDSNEFDSDNQNYGNLVSLDLSYTISDYIRLKKIYELSLLEKEITQASKLDIVKKIKLQTLFRFTDALLLSEEIKIQTQKVPVYEKLINNFRRTIKAGINSSLEMISLNREVLKNEYEILLLKNKYQAVLEDLSLITGEKYPVNEVAWAMLKCGENLIHDLDVRSQPEILLHQKNIEKKSTEVSIIQSELFPKVNLKLNYKYYDNDPDDYGKSFGNIDDKSYTIGLFVLIPFTEATKNYYSYKNGKHEVKKAKIQLDKEISDLESQFNKYQKEYYSLLKMLALDEQSLDLIDQNIAMLNRLENEKLINEKELLEKELSLLDEKIKTTKGLINKSSFIKRFEILSKGRI